MIKPITSFGDLIDTAWNFRLSKIIFTAVDLDIFNILVEGEKNKMELLKDLGLVPLAGEAFLNSLTALGLLVKEDDKYMNSEISKKFLTKQSSSYRGDILKHFHYGWAGWSDLEEILHGNRKEGADEKEDSRWRALILGMHDLGVERAKKILELVNLSNIENFLDLGGGPGTYSIVFAEKHPGLKAVVFDLPETIKIAKEVINKYGLQDRVSVKEGDFISDEFGESFDMVLLSNIIHSHGPETNRMLFDKVFRSLVDGGRIIVSDFVLNEGKAGPVHAVLFGLHMAVNTNEGRTYTDLEIKKMLGGAGFKKMESTSLDERSKLVIGYKSG